MSRSNDQVSQRARKCFEGVEEREVKKMVRGQYDRTKDKGCTVQVRVDSWKSK